MSAPRVCARGATCFKANKLPTTLAAMSTQGLTGGVTFSTFPQGNPNAGAFTTNERCFMANRSVFQELYDWFYRSYGEAPKESLLKLMKDAVDIQRLTQLSQRELAEF